MAFQWLLLRKILRVERKYLVVWGEAIRMITMLLEMGFRSLTIVCLHSGRFEERWEDEKCSIIFFFFFKFAQDFSIYQTVNVKVKHRNDKNDCRSSFYEFTLIIINKLLKWYYIHYSIKSWYFL